ncbi:insulin receptor substrate 1 isoform X3 [Procambarus clarkii]|uniref:insulin receptor substrate 1 isoform X3 n=2 Tax=Procambarus clarkii TaxID=6728 RepID=UPI001E6768A2|nr:insulin receptor substrate 1-like isoform X3 [Procambarus clarkii]
MKAVKSRSGLFLKCGEALCWKHLLAKMLPNRKSSVNNVGVNEDIVKAGYLKKLKTMKKKFFVLRRETGPDYPARLEYYDNERKFRAGAQPKKPIILRTCFSINRKKDPKHSHVIALYSNHDSVCMAAESDAELNDWLGLLHHHMHVTGADGQSRKMYEHVWLVSVQPRSLGSSKGLTGEHHICLTYKSIALVRVGDCQKKIEFPLNSIRRCGHTGSFFFLGLGRSAVTGAGDIWMLTEDAVIAENMHSIIRKAMHDPLNNMSEDSQTRERTHSVSNHRSFDSGSGPCHMRGRCDSMPSRSRTSSEGSVQNVPNKFHGHNCSHQTDGSMASSLCLHVTRPKSIPSSSESMESATSVDDFECLHSNTPDNNDGLCGSEEDSYMAMGRVGSTESSHQHRELPQPPFSLPIISTRPMGSSQSKVAGVVSPVSGSSIDGHCLSSPQDNYLEMASPSERMHAGLVGSQPERGGYMYMDKTQPQPQGSSASENCGYMSMGPLNSPGSIPTTWPSHSSSQVSSPPHSASHSRIPSVVDDTTDSYLSMVPGGHLGDMTTGENFGQDRSEGYLDMTPTPAVPTPIPYSPSDGDSFPEMSPGSSCSFTSGTPSSDHRFPDFIAEKSGSGSYYGYSEDDDSSIDRPIRTNSVGSKPEQFRSRKNRLEVSPAEPARVRAFSVGSRVSLRLAGGRAGQVAGGAIAATSVSVAEFSSSIKERGKQVKSKSTSAPILGSSPISNSWSGTPGTFFRGFLQARSQERNNDLMEFDFSKNKSCDSISADKEKKSSSFESIKRTLTGQRHRSNSKSSGNGKSVFDSIKRDKKKSESELSTKSIELSERGNYCELEINPSPHRKTSDSYDGYLPMKPAINTSQPLCTSEYLDMNSRESLIRQTSFADPYVDMSRGSDRYGSSCSSGSHDGYVDMSQGKGLGPLPLASLSSSSTTSNSSSSIGARVRKISSTLNPLSSQDSTSQLDEYMPVDFRSNTDPSSHSIDGEKHKKKEKKNSKRKSFKESTKRKKSEPINVVVKSGDSEVLQEMSKKGTSPLSSLSTLLGRKNSGTPPKTPLSPTGSPLPKSNRGTPSPFSSLTRSKNRDDKEGRKDSVGKDNSGGISSSINSGIGTSCIEESSIETEESAIPGDNLSATASSQTVPNSGEQQSKQTMSVNDCSKRILGICEAASQADTKQEESQGSVGLESLLGKGSTSQQLANTCSSDQGAYVNLALGTCDKLITESRQRKVSNTSLSDYMNISPMGSSKVSEEDTHKPHDYVNMCPGGRSESVTTSQTPPQLPPALNKIPPSSKTNIPGNNDASDKKSLNIGKGISRQHSRKDSEKSNTVSSGGDSEGGSGGESGYLLMTPGQPPPPPPKPSSPRMVAHRPDIPPALLGVRPDPSLTATLERLNFVSSAGNSSSERCRSHSGPGAPEGSAVSSEVRVKKQLSEPRSGSGCQGNNGRAASACSSPVSYSPPTSPTLGGSVSSVSSLSEGGLSSASSTCTVVNVGVGRREGGSSGSSGTSRVLDMPADLAAHSTVPSVTSQPSSAIIGSGSADSGLNYVSLDLGPAKCESVRPSPRTGRRAVSGTVTQGACTQDPVVGEEDEPLSYAQIDFTKSEGLRTTSLSRDHRH